jgi:hypothetical protein
VTLHPPDSYLSTYSFKDVVFFQREFSDMIAAGIDVALPVFFGNPANVSTWSVPGLQTMVQAEQAMAKAGQSAPKIGMFDDTSSLPALNGGKKPDLTAAAAKSLFYDEIHRFFSNVPQQFWAMIDGRPIIVLYYSSYVSAWDQTTFDYLKQQFQQDFGTTPYIIREHSWSGVTTDAACGWGSSVYGSNTIGDVVRPERRVVLAGGSPVRVSAGAPGSRLQPEGEIRPSQAECRKPLKERGANQRAATISECNSLVRLSAERCLRGPSRSCRGEGNRHHSGPERVLDLSGVWGGGTLGKSNAEQERSYLAAESGKDRGYKAGRLKAHGAGRKSEGSIVPVKACSITRWREGALL